jgi:hypothetical protein
MPLYTADALVLRTYKLGEADRIVVFLTRRPGQEAGGRRARAPGTVAVPGGARAADAVRVAYFEKERRELVSLNYAEPCTSPLVAASPEALGYSHYFAELIDEWAAEADAGRAAVSSGHSVLDALVSGVPVEPLARYFECWLLRAAGGLSDGPVAVGRRGGVRERPARRTPGGRTLGAGAHVCYGSWSSLHRILIVSLLGPRAASMNELRTPDSDKPFHVTLQDLILKLSAFWASQGCLIQQPLDLEVGAGTSHPETLLARARSHAVERRLRPAVAAARTTGGSARIRTGCSSTTRCR